MSAKKCACKPPSRHEAKGRYVWAQWLWPVAGLVALTWFLVRVIPKLSRASYPCQRIAAPLAGSFIIWLMAVVGSTLACRKAKAFWGKSRYVVAGAFTLVTVGVIWIAATVTGDHRAVAAFMPIDPPNVPIGVARGI